MGILKADFISAHEGPQGGALGVVSEVTGLRLGGTSIGKGPLGTR